MKILIAYDGSGYADDAVEELQRAGLPNEVEVVVLTVTDVWEPPTLPIGVDRVSSRTEKQIRPNLDDLRRYEAEALEQADDIALVAVRRIQEMFPEWKVSAEVRTGKPAWEVIKKADEWQPELVIVGSQGRTALGRLFLGSVSNKVLTEADCSVRVSKRHTNDDNVPLRVLIAVDGSENAEAAVKTVAKRQWTDGTEIRLVAVDDPFRHPEIGYLAWNLSEDKPEDNEESRAWISEVIEKPTQLLKSAGLDVSHFIKWGDAANMILNEANEWKPDAIFVGARGLGGFKRFWLGSVSAAIASRAECSVEVVRIKGEQRRTRGKVIV